MKKTKNLNKKYVGAGPVSAQNGITLIALIITIIVMLILVAVTISMAINGGLFQKAGDAVSDTENATILEQNLASGEINVDGLVYDSVEDYISNTPSEKNYEIVSEEITGANGDFKYVKLQNGEIQLTRYIGTATEVTIPAKYDGYTVYAVGNIEVEWENAATRYNIFGETNSIENTTITSIAFEEGIKKIGTAAFSKCSGLTGDLNLPSTLKEIGDAAFHRCSGFTGDLVIPEGVIKLESIAFQHCSGFNGKLTLPTTLKEIGEWAFNYCGNLIGDLKIPEGVRTIGKAAFQHCSGFDGTITLPSTLKEIEQSSFLNCSSLIGNLVIPEGVTKIGNGAFENCRGLNGTLTLPSTITEIGQSAFYYCSGLTGEINTEGITVGENAFLACTGLTIK